MADEHLKGQGAIGGWPKLFRVQDCRAGFSNYQLRSSYQNLTKRGLHIEIFRQFLHAKFQKRRPPQE
jgi:hypothetical protein